MKRLFAIALAIVMLVGLFSAAALAAGTKTVSIQIEGVTENLYYNSALEVPYDDDTLTVTDVLSYLSGRDGAPSIVITSGAYGAYVSKVNDIEEGSYNEYDGWMYRVNSASPVVGMDVYEVEAGDEIVLYYSDEFGVGMQYPEIDMTQMLVNGSVVFTSMDVTYDSEWNEVISRNPVAGASVIWDNMSYITDANGVIIIDSSGMGDPHSVSIDRYDASGVPTVLRFPPNHTVSYCYSDVNVGDWFYDAVIFTTNSAIFKGVSATEFNPNAAMTRAMFVTVLGRYMNVQADHSVTTPFSDVVNDGWSTGYIYWASQNQIVNGYDATTFGPNDEISREQMATILHRFVNRYFDPTVDTGDLSGFGDSDKVSDYAKSAMLWATSNGLINGINGDLVPQGSATRAQVAVILHRLILSIQAG